MLRGRRYASGGALSADDFHELVDLLAIRIYERLAESFFLLSRSDLSELVKPYIKEFVVSDQQEVDWFAWETIQAGAKEREE